MFLSPEFLNLYPQGEIIDKIQYQKQVDDPLLIIERIQNPDAVQLFIEEVKCPICYDILFDPKCCSECEQAFCEKCLKKWIDQNQVSPLCPCCRVNITKKRQKIPPKLLIALLNKLQLTCKNKNLGCTTIIFYEQLKKHEQQECLYVLIKCDNICCTERVLRKDLQKHKLVCQYEIIECIKCQQNEPRYKMEIHLQEKCPCRESTCKWCHSTMEYRDLLSHESDCPCGYEKCKNCNTKYSIDKFQKHTKLKCMKKQKKYFKKKFESEERLCYQLNEKIEQQDELIHKLQSLLQGENFTNLYQSEENSEKFIQWNNYQDDSISIADQKIDEECDVVSDHDW
ncbi:unnamed protein product [Paramecium sonneborni]|uniref:RING-type domain-containing protein n=1 Tax=Paramecium sonneborni TaxID=65129 RepID=A0A8S1MMA3_9CILI|nr:unnamed protein product [Paramecium sonneborni]